MTDKAPKNAHLWARHPDDWYVEERFAVAELFKRETFAGCVWDPCCGRGHIIAEAALFGYEVFGSDIADRARITDDPFVVADFLTSVPFALGESVVMNPPFRGGDADTGIEGFVRQAMRYRSVQKIAAFIPWRFLWGAERARDFWTYRPPSRVYMITPRPSCPPGPVLEAGEEPGGGNDDFAWAVWERDADDYWPETPTELRWIIGPDRRRRRAAA
jgi:SAM-dependent methyltransferase